MASKILSVPLVPQHDHPFCFYACVSMVMKYFGIDKSVADIAREVMFRFPGDFVEMLGESASSLKDYLSDYGLEADIHREQEWGDIKRYIDQEFPLIAGVQGTPSSLQIDHAWVIRGYEDGSAKNIIYNNPQNDPGTQDPVAYDPDGDSVPGRTMSFKIFDRDYWTGPFPFENRTLIAVSYKGQGASAGNFFDWRGAAIRAFGDFYYHISRFVEKIFGLELFEAIFELVLTAIGIVGLVVGAIQILGQFVEKVGIWLIGKGKEFWDGGGIGGKILGGIMIVVGVIITGIGYIIDFVGGFFGSIVDGLGSVVDAIGSIFTGSSGDSETTTLDNSTIAIGLNLTVRPWRSRWGKNWEKISGSWSVSVTDGTTVDELDIHWKIQVWGWGVDRWSLSRHVLEYNGTLNTEVQSNSTRYNKRFHANLFNSQGIRMGFGENKCYYGRDGGLTRVKLEVSVTARRGNHMVNFNESTSVWGLST